jgi:hypothetical protein
VEILKYLDVLIGLAVVMVLLSPLVSGLTQMVLWVLKVRPVRLRLALTTLIGELNGEAFDLYDTVVVTGLPANVTELEFQQPAPQPPIRVPVAAGRAILDKNVAAMLRANVTAEGLNDLALALQTVPAGPWPAGAVITLQLRGTQDFVLTSDPVGVTGNTKVTYRYDGPVQFASRQFTCAVTPAGGNVTAAVIDSGEFKGAALQSTGAGTFRYHDNVSPMPTPHDLILTVTGGDPGDSVSLNFQGDRTHDRINPVAGPGGLSEPEAKDLAGQVLSHPMIGKPPTWFKWLRKWEPLNWGEVVEREELIRILLGLASTNPRLRALLARNGIPDPERAVADIRKAAQRIEAEKPGDATHERLAQAILESARSSFVGIINNWFDQLMDRTTAEYRFRAQMVTIVAALVVACTVQMDSIDLLRRLSTDDKLRDSLVEQAQQQQDRIEKPSPNGSAAQDQADLQLAKSRRDQIEANLATMRDPQLDILPDHLIWQRLPKARLMRNDEWMRPAQRLELVIGSSIVMIEPRWTSDPLADIEDAVRNSIASVTVGPDRQFRYIVTSPPGGPDIDRLHLRLGSGDKVNDALSHTPNLAVTSLLDPSAKIPSANLFLIVGYGPHYPIQVAAPMDIASLAKALNDVHAELSIQLDTTGATPDIVLQATKPETRWIELRRRDEEPESNILQPTTFSGGNAVYDVRIFDNAPSCTVISGDKEAPVKPSCTPKSAWEALNAADFEVSGKWQDQLVFTSHRTGALQLRSVPGKSESNILNREPEWSCDLLVCVDKDLFQRSWRGILLTWVLLSLGAPFWYDALKDLLKLRSSLAKKDDDARKDRQTSNPSAAQKA